LKENLQPLKSWGFCIVNSACDEVTLQTFIKVFIDTYIGHGGRIENKNPTIINNGRADLAQTVADSRNAVGKAANANPQIIFYVLPGRDSMVYERLKRSMECRFGLVSQMLAVNHVRKANAQYCSNVCMKVNAKLGGVTCRVAGPPGPSFPCPTMFIGADVSHASPGSQQASTCAITMSMDTDATRYAAFVQTNGQRVEMITPENIESGFMMLFKYWVDTHKKGPEQVYYFRDGVSEGQYSHVLAQEIEPMKAAIIKQYGPKAANVSPSTGILSSFTNFFHR
jgi:eukaryotic translation initiation factor 2C